MIDLEDSVPAEDSLKREAKKLHRCLLDGAERSCVPPASMRCGFPWFTDDVVFAASLGISGVIVPKMTRFDQLDAVQVHLDRLGAPSDFEVWPIVESAAFLLGIERTDRLPDRVKALVIGMVDLSYDLMPLAFLEPEGLDAAAARSGLQPSYGCASSSSPGRGDCVPLMP